MARSSLQYFFISKHFFFPSKQYFSLKYPFLIPLCILFCILFSSASYAQGPQGPQGQTDQQQMDNAGPAIILTVLRGNPEKGGGETQEFQITSGEKIFVKVDQSGDADADKPDIAYEAQVNKVSTEIANKITDVQAKQREYNDEIYPAFRAPIDLEKQAMESELQNLRAQRDKIESEQRSKQAEKKIQAATAPKPRPKVATGLNVQVSVETSNISIDIKPKGLKGDNAETNIQAPPGKWVKVLGKEDTNEGTELWMKADIVQPQ